MFSGELELGKLLGSAGIVQEAHRAILETNSAYEIHTTPSGMNVLAFNCAPDYTIRFLDREFQLVPSENLKLVDFISTQVNPSFSINEAAVELFQHIGDDLEKLLNKYIDTSLVITGSGLAGFLAILSTLRLHHAIDVEESNGYEKTKRPICITFGCPLVGDAALQRAISERPQWKFSFLNFVAKKDPVASLFSSNALYEPLGTYLFCEESGGHTAFEDQESILLVLDVLNLLNEDNFQIYDYTNVLSLLIRKALYREGGNRITSGEFNGNLLRAGIALQLKEVGILDDISDDQIREMEKRRTMKNAYHDPVTKLSGMKVSLSDIECYMNVTKKKVGYYDYYKDAKHVGEIQRRQEIMKNHRMLNDYWKKIVDEKNVMQQKEATRLRRRWLYGGNNYRRMLEPLDIAEYYRKGNKNYIENRPNHYKLLEKWLDEDKNDSKSREVKRNEAASLTEDSCFWAYVEEALILLRNLENGGSSNDEKKLEEFEDYVMRAIKNYSVSPEIFLKGSSLMTWWNAYKAHKGATYASEFAQYMNSESYKFYQ